jgi:hypothetical protein
MANPRIREEEMGTACVVNFPSARIPELIEELHAHYHRWLLQPREN